MHLLILSDDYPSDGRPSFVFVQQLVHALVKLDVEVSVVAPQSLTHAVIHRQKLLPRQYHVALEDGYHYSVYRPYSLSFGNKGHRLSAFFQWFNQRNINRVLKSVNPSVLYGHFWHSAQKLSQYASDTGIPLFVACGEGDNAIENLVSRLSNEDCNRLSSLVRGVISVSSENKRKCIDYGLANENDIIVLPNCTDDTMFYAVDAQKRESIRQKLGVSKNDFFVLFVGGFIPRKGADRVSKAIDKIGDAHIKSCFIGKAMAGVESRPTCQGIIYKGTLEHDKLPDYYRAADVFCLPTLNEGCCNAIMESLSCGTPVISSNRPFNADILNSENAILVNPESIDEISEAIYMIKNDKELLAKKKEYTKAHSCDYSIKQRAQRIHQFICEKCDDK